MTWFNNSRTTHVAGDEVNTMKNTRATATMISIIVASACVGPPGDQGAEGREGIQGEPGQSGTTSLVRLESELPGSNCRRGGTAVLSGLDSNQSGVLEEEEITDTAFVCSPCTDIADGDLRVATEADLQPLAGKCRLRGRLTVAPEFDGSLDPLLELEEISTFEMQSNIAVETVSMPNLSRASALILSGNATLASIVLPKLQFLRVDQEFVDENQGFRGGLIVQTYPQLRALALESAIKVDGFVSFLENENLESIRMGSLAEVGEYFEILNNEDLDEISFASLRAVRGDLTISGNVSLPTCRAAQLVEQLEILGGQTRIEDNSQVGSCP
jgi:hypothetical protein